MQAGVSFLTNAFSPVELFTSASVTLSLQNPFRRPRTLGEARSDTGGEGKEKKEKIFEMEHQNTRCEDERGKRSEEKKIIKGKDERVKR